MLFHLDEHVDHRIARALRQRGIDVTPTSPKLSTDPAKCRLRGVSSWLPTNSRFVSVARETR